MSHIATALSNPCHPENSWSPEASSYERRIIMTQATRQAHDPLRCPRCGSRYTQSLSMAYSQAARAKGEQNLSEFAASIAPPTRKSVPLLAISAGLVVAYVVYLAVWIWSSETGRHWFRFCGWFDHRLVVPAAIAGLCIAYLVGAWAANYNQRNYPVERQAWEGKAVCRRCSKIFEPNYEERS